MAGISFGDEPGAGVRRARASIDVSLSRANADNTTRASLDALCAAVDCMFSAMIVRWRSPTAEASERTARQTTYSARREGIPAHTLSHPRRVWVRSAWRKRSRLIGEVKRRRDVDVWP